MGDGALEKRVQELEAELATKLKEAHEVAARRQLLAAVVEASRDAIWSWTPDGIITSWNAEAERLLQYRPDEIIGKSILALVAADRSEIARQVIANLSQGGSYPQYDTVRVRKDGVAIPVELTVSPVKDDAGIIIGAATVARNITARKEAEARQLVLARELQHRTKNMLAVIQSIARNTLDRSADLKSAKEALIGRLHALAHAQDFVAAGPRGGVSLADLVNTELKAFAARANVCGETVVVGSGFAHNFALILHELATNAIKHGALSADSGHVDIVWTIDRAANIPDLRFCWLERGGSAVSVPTRSGFGMEILGLLRGAEPDFTADDFEYRLRLPLAEVEMVSQ
jgi:two-component system, chemotaxis family, CheB/CheR fusion protein